MSVSKFIPRKFRMSISKSLLASCELDRDDFGGMQLKFATFKVLSFQTNDLWKVLKTFKLDEFTYDTIINF
jgi:hypothetical protein